jgi:ribonucleases P/MRP protein subunit RPP40
MVSNVLQEGYSLTFFAVVEIDLKQPSMLHGKKGFDRLVWAAKNVLNQLLTWLFCDMQSGRVNADSGESLQQAEVGAEATTLAVYHPTIVDVEPSQQELIEVLVPALTAAATGLTTMPTSNSAGTVDFDSLYEIVEWLSLVAIDSPRVLAKDSVDTYLSRYEVPDVAVGCTADVQSLRVLRWQGLMSANWVTELLIACM